MKINFIYALMLLGFGGFLFMGNSTGPGANGNGDRTGGPLSGGTNCAACHGGGTSNPANPDVTFKDSGGATVTEYTPGETYTIELDFNSSNTPLGAGGFGFQAVLLDSLTDSEAGTIANPSTSIQITTINNVDYVEHSTTIGLGVYSFEWTAPSTSVGTVSMHYSTLVVNSNSQTTGDVAAAGSVQFPSAVGVAVDKLGSLKAEMNIYPNPVESQLNLEVAAAEAGNYDLEIVTMAGQQIQQQRIMLTTGQNSQQINVENLPQGQYILRLVDDQNRQLSKTFVKR